MGALNRLRVGDGRVLVRAFDALRIPSFRIFWTGMFFSTAGMQMDLVLRAWLAFHLSGSGLALGSVVLARGLPQLVLPLFAGVAVDRVEKRILLFIAQLSFAVLALLTAVLVHLGLIQVWHLMVIGVLQGTVLSFNLPLRHAYIGRLVDRNALANATALNLTMLNLNTVLAPAVGGLLLATSPALAFYVVAALFGIAGIRLNALPKVPPAATKRALIREIREGVGYVMRQPDLRALMGLLFLGVGLGLPFQQFLPVFQADVLRVDASALGLMYATFGVGSLGGSLLVAHFADHPHRGLIQLLAGAALGVGLVLFALSTTYLAAMLLLLFLGLAGQIYMTMNTVLLILTTRQELQARVMSFSLIIWSVMLLLALPLGALVDLLGAPPTFAASGGLLAGIFLLKLSVRYRRGAPREAPSRALP